MIAAQTLNGPTSDQDASWRAAMEIDLRAAMILARASTAALSGLSPAANRQVREAIALEIAAMDHRGDPTGLAAAHLVRQYVCVDDG